MSIAETPRPTQQTPIAIGGFPTDEILAEPTKRWTVEEYQRLLETGLLKNDDPYELIDGWLVQKMTKNPAHEYALEYLTDPFSGKLPAGYRRRCQQAITLVDGVPEPDIAIVRGQRELHATRHPSGSEVALVIEVADSTLARDRGIKLQSYAKANIPVYWIVDIAARTLEVYTSPLPTGSYAVRRTYQSQEEMEVAIDHQAIGQLAIRELFAPDDDQG